MGVHPCDVLLIVEEHRFPVHGGIFAWHSRVSSNVVGDLNNSRESKVDAKGSVKVNDAVEDAEMVLSTLYGSSVLRDSSVDQMDRPASLPL